MEAFAHDKNIEGRYVVDMQKIYDKACLMEDLRNMGIAPGDALMVHSSMKSIGQVEGGADTVVDAFMEYLAADGLLMMPAHTWKQMSDTYNVFDPATEPGCVGIIPEIFRKRKGVVRSLHPTHSIAAYGRFATDYVKGEENLTTPCTPGGCWDRLRNVNAKILLVGVTHARNTFIHSIEEVFDVPERFTERSAKFNIKMPDGTLKSVSMYRHYNVHTAHISESFDKMLSGYEKTGAAKKVRFGDAECILCDAVKLFDVTARILNKNKNCFIECKQEIPEDWYTEV